MKKLIILVLVLALISSAHAVVTNPDDFESYTPTATWVPTESGQGWVMDTVNPDPGSPDNFSVKILDTGGRLGGNALEVSSADAGNGDNDWYASAPAAGITVLSADFKITAEGPTYNQGRLYCHFGSIGSTSISFDTYSSGSMTVESREDDYSNHQAEAIPGYVDADALGVWYRMELEMDWNTGLARGRLTDLDNTIVHPWSNTIPAYDSATDGPGLNGVNVVTNGVVVIDNISLTQGGGAIELSDKSDN